MRKPHNLFNWLREQSGVGLVKKEGLGYAVLPLSENLTFVFPDEPPQAWHESAAAAALAYYEKTEDDLPGLREKLSEALQAFKKRHKGFELYWDYRDELGEKDIQRALEDGNFDEVEQDLVDFNRESLWLMRDEAAKDLLGQADIDEDHPCYEVLREEAEEWLREEMYDDANIRDLIRNTSAWGFVVIPEGVETYMEGWRGIRDLEEVESICALLNVSPHHLQGLVAEDGLALPEIPEREGHEAVKPSELYSMFVESIHGGNLCFMISLDLADWFLNGGKDLADEHGLVIHKDTDVTLHDYCNGATSCGFATLLRDLVLPAKSFEIRYDRARHYGIQSCCDLTTSAWGGSVSANKPPDEKD